MANTKITELTEDTSPTSDDLLVTVNDVAGVPTNKKVAAGDLVTKAHGLSDGNVVVASGALTTSGDINAGTANINTVVANIVEASARVELGGDGALDSVILDASAAVGTFTQSLQASDGTIALTSDIPTVDSTSVAAAGAVMESDTTTAAMGFVVDEDDMVSDTATKVPTQQSVKAYVDAQIISSVSGDVVGPGSATDNTIARYDGTTGKLLQNSNVTLSDAGDLKLTANRYLQADNIEPSSNGSLNFVGKSGTSIYEQGRIVVSGGINAGTGDGGSIILQGGQAMDGGVNGAVKIGNTGGYYASLDVSALTADRTLKLRNSTVDLTGGSDGDVLTVQADGSLAVETPAAGLSNPMTASGDIIYGGTSGTPTRLAKGTDGQVLTLASGVPSWAAASGGGSGQTTYDAIVASSGGTHTTLRDALTAASAGWRILILDSTTETANISSNLAGITIVGASCSVAVNMSTYSLSLGGNYVAIENLNINFTSGYLFMNGMYYRINGCYLSYSAYDASTTGCVSLYGTAGEFTNNRLYNSATSGTASRVLFVNSQYTKVVNNILDVPVRATNSVHASIVIGGGRVTFANNKIQSYSNVNDAYLMKINDPRNVIYGNDISSLSYNYAIYSASGEQFIENNYIHGASRAIWLESSANTIIGNSIICTVSGSFMVRLNGGYNRVQSNHIQGQGTSDYGIYVDGNNDNVISGNYFTNMNTGIQLNSASTVRTVITGNNLHNATTKIVDNSIGTIIKDNLGVAPNFDKHHYLMKNTSGVSLSAGQVVIIKNVAAGDEVTTTTTAGYNKVYGIATATITNNSYGYIQTLGKATTLKVNGTTDIAIGDYLSTYTEAGIAKKASAGETAFAIALEAYTTDDSNGVLDALLITPRLI